jgi:transposase
MERPMQKLNDLSRCLNTLQMDGTLIAVIEMGLSSWLVAGIVPGVKRQPLKKLAIDEKALLKLLHRWRDEAAKAGHRITRITVAFEAGRMLDGSKLSVPSFVFSVRLRTSSYVKVPLRGD